MIKYRVEGNLGCEYVYEIEHISKAEEVLDDKSIRYYYELDGKVYKSEEARIILKEGEK